MAATLTLRLVDSSSKECEVTGREMGGDDHYEIPLSELKPGTVKWPSTTQPEHSVHVVCVGRDFVEVNVIAISRSIHGPKRLYAGEKWRYSYMFGEWSYGYTLSLEWVKR